LRSRAQVGTPDHDVWSIAVDQDTGKPLERPRELLRGLGWVGGLSASQIGRRLLFWRSDITGQVFVSEFNGSTRMMGPPRRLTLDQSAGTKPVDWTADSRAVVLLSVHNGKLGVYKQRVDETTREPLFDFGKAPGILPRLTGDGSEILYAETDRPNDPNAPVSLMAVPIGGGTPRVILQEPGVGDAQCAKPPSQVCILNEFVAGTSFYYLLDLHHGKGRLIAKLPGLVNYGLSPDGSTLALDDARTVRFVSIDSGIVKDVVVKDWPVRKSADWSADGKALLVASVNTQDVPVVLSFDIEGNVKVLLQGDRNIPFRWVIPSPDGKYGALAVSTGESNVWMVENY
jgi:Tol biopolymer transport system component